MSSFRSTPVVVYMSDAMLEHIDHIATGLDKKRATYLRELVATAIHYDLQSDPQPSHSTQRKYANAAERREALNTRSRARRATAREVEQALKRGERLHAIAILEQSLKRQDKEDSS